MILELVWNWLKQEWNHLASSFQKNDQEEESIELLKKRKSKKGKKNRRKEKKENIENVELNNSTKNKKKS